MKTFERSKGCRNIRREIEEAGQDEALSPAINAHMKSCGECETFFDQQFKLRAMVASLGIVTAPNDFEFRLRARLVGEKRGASKASATGKFSFSLRAAALASVVLLVGFGMLAIGLRPGTDGSLPVVAQSDAKPSVEQPVAPESKVAEEVAENVVENNGNRPAPASAPPVSGLNTHGTSQRVGHRNGSGGARLATAGNRSGSRDMGKSSAKVVRINELVASDGHTVFPIDAAPQSVKVSLDNGRGTPKTISVPGVSFGSQRTLSQNPTPLVASSRGAW